MHILALFAEGQIRPCSVALEKIKNSLKAHYGYCAEKPRFHKCYFCNATRQSHQVLNSHMLKKHPHKTLLKCDYVACLDLFFASEEERNIHMKEQHNNNSEGRKVLRCVYCDLVYLCRSKLLTHYRIAHRSISLRCTYGVCGEYFKSEADLQLHLEKNHQRGKKCIYCDKVFSDCKRLWDHTKTMHEKIKVKCNYTRCATYFKSKADREQHIKEKHLTDQKLQKCVYCDKFVRCMKMHVRSYHSQVAIKCNYSLQCTTYFKSDSDRDKHVKSVHLAGKVKQMVDCVYCGKSYPKGSSMRWHTKVMHGGIAIKCSNVRCAEYFKNQEDCDQHFKDIHYEKEISKNKFCSHCSFKTHDKRNLVRHFRRFHGLNEMLKCTQCPADSEKTFKSSWLLKEHISATHEGIKSCPQCNISIHKHKLSSHLLLEYCSMCNMNYPCKGAMKKHKLWCKQKCEICLYECSGIQLLKHLTDVHKIVDLKKLSWLGDLRNLEKNVKCEECERCFYNTNALNHHVSFFHRERKYKDRKNLLSCDHCKKQLLTRNNIERHMLTVHGFKKSKE